MLQFLADGVSDVPADWLKNFVIVVCAVLVLWDKFRTKPPVVPDPVRTRKAEVFATEAAMTAVEERLEKKVDVLTADLKHLMDNLASMDRRIMEQGEARLLKVQELVQHRVGAMEARVNLLAETLAAVRAQAGGKKV